MKVIDILIFNRELLENIISVGIKLDDVKYIDLYTDYSQLKAKGEKISYIVAILSLRYSVSERKVYSILKRLQMNANLVQHNRVGEFQ